MKLYRYDSKTLQFKKVPFTNKIFKIIFTVLFIFLFLGMSTPNPPVKYITNTENVLLVTESNKFSEEKLHSVDSDFMDQLLDFVFPCPGE